MSWQVHLPALVVSVPLLGAFISIAMVKPRCVIYVCNNFSGHYSGLSLRRYVAINGTLVYVMGGEDGTLHFLRMTLPIR